MQLERVERRLPAALWIADFQSASKMPALHLVGRSFFRMSPKKTYSPLFVWKLLLVAVILGIVILCSIDPIRVEVAQRRAALPKKLDKIEPAQNETRVVFFGNSLLECALPQNEKRIAQTLNRIVSRSGYEHEPVRVINLSDGWRSSWDLKKRADRILALHPAVLVIQAEMILRRKFESTEDKQNSFVHEGWERLRNWARFLKAPLMKELGGNKRQRKNDDALMRALSSQAQIDLQILKKNEQKSLEEVNLQRAREIWGGQLLSTSAREYLSTKTFIQRAQEKGILVIVIETPVSETAARFATKNYLNERATIIKELLKSESDLYVRFPGFLADTYFNDYSHLNREGEKIFFEWLGPVLANLIVQEKLAAK